MAEHEDTQLPPVTEGRLEDVQSELQRREPIFHRPEMGTTRADFDAMTAPDFWEVGASGRIYSREAVWPALEQRYSDPDYWATDEWEATDFRCREAGAQTYVLTYTLRQGTRVTRRVTIWRRAGEAWQIVYHQGTVVA